MENYPAPINSIHKISALTFLRAQDKFYNKRLKKQGRLIRRKKYLRQQINQNKNIFEIFQISINNKFNRKVAQNTIWQKNYRLKIAINILKQELSSLKAKLWNIQKQNRKMDKQIQSWNLQKLFMACIASPNKPYIDMATVSKVFIDQDYQIVSTKIDISKYQMTLQEKQWQIDRLSQKIKDSHKIQRHLRYQIGEQKCQLLEAIECMLQPHKQPINGQNQNQNLLEEQFDSSSFISNLKGRFSSQLISASESLIGLQKTVEIKKKLNTAYNHQLHNLQKQLHQFTSINESQIDKLKQKTRRIKLQQQNLIKNFKKQLKAIRREGVGFQYGMQQDVGNFVSEKIRLRNQIQTIVEKVKDLSNWVELEQEVKMITQGIQ